MSQVSETKAALAPKIGIVAQVIKKCDNCNAPGVYQDAADPQWDCVPGVQVPRSDERYGKYVGETCPNCGEKRKKIGKPIHVFKAKRGWFFGF